MKKILVLGMIIALMFIISGCHQKTDLSSENIYLIYDDKNEIIVNNLKSGEKQSYLINNKNTYKNNFPDKIKHNDKIVTYFGNDKLINLSFDTNDQDSLISKEYDIYSQNCFEDGIYVLDVSIDNNIEKSGVFLSNNKILVESNCLTIPIDLEMLKITNSFNDMVFITYPKVSKTSELVIEYNNLNESYFEKITIDNSNGNFIEGLLVDNNLFLMEVNNNSGTIIYQLIHINLSTREVTKKSLENKINFFPSKNEHFYHFDENLIIFDETKLLQYNIDNKSLAVSYNIGGIQNIRSNFSNDRYIYLHEDKINIINLNTFEKEIVELPKNVAKHITKRETSLNFYIREE